MNRRPWILTLGILTLVWSPLAIAITQAQGPVVQLDADHKPLVAEFNAGEGNPRLVIVLSPT